MSANNIIIVDLENFEVRTGFFETDFSEMEILGVGKNLEKAIEIAEKFCQDEEVEYGIRFLRNYAREKKKEK